MSTIKPTWQEMKSSTGEYHKAALQMLGLGDKDFMPKKVFNWSKTFNGQKEDCIYLYKEEGEKPLYAIELYDREGVPFSPRKLFKWMGDNNFVDEHQIAEHSSYRLYLHELVEVPAPVIQKSTPTLQLIEPWEAPEERKFGMKMDKMTIRDFAAITWRIPVADHDEVNQLIVQHFEIPAKKAA